MGLPLLDYMAERITAEIERLRRMAASGSPGCREARKRMEAARTEQLRWETCRARGWRGSLRA